MSFFKSLFKIIAIILVIIAIIALIYAALVALAEGAVAGSATIFGATIGNSSWMLLTLGVGLLALASIVSPEGFEEAISRVEAGASAVGSTIGNVVGNVVGGVVSGVVSSPWVIGALVLGAWYLFRDGNESDDAKLPTSNYTSDVNRVKALKESGYVYA